MKQTNSKKGKVSTPHIFIFLDRHNFSPNKSAQRGAPRFQIRSFFEHRSKGGGHFHVQKFWSKFCMILKAFWQHKIDIKILFKGRNVSNLG